MKIKSMQDDYIQAAAKALEGLVVAKVPGAYWVEFMPFLKYLPRWVPGTAFHKMADRYRPYTMRTRDQPFEMAKKNLVRDGVESFDSLQYVDGLPVIYHDGV